MELHQQRVQNTHQQAGHGGHQTGWHTNGVNSFGDAAVRAHVRKGDVDAGVGPEKVEYGQAAGCHLPGHRGDCGTGDTQGRQPQ